jgi:mxaJ protein
MNLLIAVALTLRVCADPNNMPFSNRALQGFENEIAAVLADELHETVTYTWWAQRRAFLRHTITAGLCDVIIGITPGAGPSTTIATTAPYYRSTYVFITREQRGLRLSSFDDPRLRRLKIGIHVIGDDYNALPPAVALARRGMVRNVVGYSIYGNYAEDSPPSKLIDAVARDDVDVAVAWGPLAGYYARREPVRLVLSPVATPAAVPGISFTYDIAIGVRKDSTALRARLDRALLARRDAIRRILHRYGVPCA